MNFLRDFDQKLRGLPERTITIFLLFLAIFAAIVALYGSPTLKAALLVWIVAP